MDYYRGMRAFLFHLGFSLLASSAALGEQFLGLSAFGAMSSRYPCSKALTVLDEATWPGFSVLWRSFGDSPRCVRRFLRKYEQTPHLLQVHLSNEVCRRNRRCGSGELFQHTSSEKYDLRLQIMSPRTEAIIAARVKAIRDSFEPYFSQNTTVVLSIGLEDDFSAEAARMLVETLRHYWPFLISRNPSPSRKWAFSSFTAQGSDFLEGHQNASLPSGFSPYRDCIYNEDGSYRDDYGNVVLDSRETLKQYRSCLAIFLWRPEHQGIFEGEGWLPPRKRKMRINDVVDLQEILHDKKL